MYIVKERSNFNYRK